MKKKLSISIAAATCLLLLASGACLASDHSGSAMSAAEALERLREGNEYFLRASDNPGDISPYRRQELKTGQEPYAVIVTCSDSRVAPEHIFSAGLGELFVIRVAGNVLGHHQLASVEYAVGHLGTKLVVVMGHESCGAIAAAIDGHAEGYVQALVNAIKAGIGSENDPRRASVANAAYVARETRSRLKLGPDTGVTVTSACYYLDGRVEFEGDQD